MPWVVQVDKLGEAQAVAPAIADYRPTDPQIAWHLARFIEQVRAIPADPVDRAPELAARLRIHDRSRCGRAERLCPRQRSLRQGRQAPGRGRGLQRHPRLARQLPRRLDRALLRERPARCDGALDRDPHHRGAARHATPIACGRIRSASTSTPSTGRRSSDNEAAFPQSRCAGSRHRDIFVGPDVRNSRLADRLRRAQRLRAQGPMPPDISLRRHDAGSADARSAGAGGGRGGAEAAAAARPAEAHAGRKNAAGGEGSDSSASLRPMRRLGCSRCATASSTPCRSIRSRPARSIRSMPRPARSPTSRCRPASSSSAPARSPPATPCAGSSATPKAGQARPSASTSSSSRPGPICSPISSSTPIGAPIFSSCVRPRRPIWPRCPGSIRKTSSSRCVARMPPRWRRSPSPPASTSRR